MVYAQSIFFNGYIAFKNKVIINDYKWRVRQRQKHTGKKNIYPYILNIIFWTIDIMLEGVDSYCQNAAKWEFLELKAK